MDISAVNRGDILIDTPYVYHILTVTTDGKARLLRPNGDIETTTITPDEPWEHVPNATGNDWLLYCAKSRAAQRVATNLSGTNLKDPISAYNAAHGALDVEVGLQLTRQQKQTITKRLGEYAEAVSEARAWVAMQRIRYDKAVIALFEKEPEDTYSIAKPYYFESLTDPQLELRGATLTVGRVYRFNCKKNSTHAGRSRGYFRVDSIKGKEARVTLDDGTTGNMRVSDWNAWEYPLQLVTDTETYDCSNKFSTVAVDDPAEGFAYAKYLGMMRHLGVEAAKAYQNLFEKPERPAMLTGLFRKDFKSPLYTGSCRPPHNIQEAYKLANQEIDEVYDRLADTERELRAMRELTSFLTK